MVTVDSYDLAAAQVLSASLDGRPVSWDAPLGPGTGSGGSVGGSPDVLRVEAPVAAAGPFVRAHESVYVPRSRASVDGAAVADLMARSIACYEELLGVPYPRWRTSGPATW